MSYKNPNVNDILNGTTGVMGSHIHKSYLKLAKLEFHKRHQRKATFDDRQELRDIIENEWATYYSHEEMLKRNIVKTKVMSENFIDYSALAYNNVTDDF